MSPSNDAEEELKSASNHSVDLPDVRVIDREIPTSREDTEHERAHEICLSQICDKDRKSTKSIVRYIVLYMISHNQRTTRTLLILLTSWHQLVRMHPSLMGRSLDYEISLNS